MLKVMKRFMAHRILQLVHTRLADCARGRDYKVATLLALRADFRSE